ncbi:MAG: hypothetical protein AB1627_00090 [Chloroflexota bacterium]
MTHEYVIGLRGVVLGAVPDAGTPAGPSPTAVAWAADRMLAVGTDDEVRGISRGDSTFLDLAGCAVMPLPSDVVAAERLVRAAVARGRPFDPVRLLADAGLLAADATIEVGAPADLAFWTADPATVPASDAATVGVIAVLRAGHFTDGDEHVGPFARLPGS